MDNDCKAWPLAGTLDYDRMGYLQHDLYPSRLFFPTVLGLHEVEITPHNGQLEVKTEGLPEKASSQILTRSGQFRTRLT